MRHENTLRTARLGMLLAFALILGYAESLVPLPFGVPGMKLGLPNLAVLLTMYLFGNREALLVNAARVCLTAFLFGSLSSLLYSLAGALCSFLVMTAVRKNPRFSLTGVSCAGGIAHNAAQLAVAVFVTETAQILFCIPPLLLCGCLTGFCLGLICRGVLASLGRDKRAGRKDG